MEQSATGRQNHNMLHAQTKAYSINWTTTEWKSRFMLKLNCKRTPISLQSKMIADDCENVVYVKMVGLEISEHNIYSAHLSTYIWHSHPRIKSMSIWPVCRSICLELGHTPIEEDGARFWFERASAGLTELSVVWRSEVPALCTLSAALFFAFELEHKKLPTIT